MIKESGRECGGSREGNGKMDEEELRTVEKKCGKNMIIDGLNDGVSSKNRNKNILSYKMRELFVG